METLPYVIFLMKILLRRLTLRLRKLRNIYVVTTLFVRRTYVLFTLLYSGLKTPYLTKQAFS